MGLPSLRGRSRARRKPWIFALAWIAPGPESGWLTDWVPFPLVGLATALMIVSVSPRHDLQSEEDVEQFEREQTAVLFSVTALIWILVAMTVGAIAVAYLK